MLPRVAIGLPVYNGEKYLRGALNSLRAQTYTDFSITISDNASTDSTGDICREFARAYPQRVSYHRNETNCGAAENFNRAFRLCADKGEYFMWAGHDDLWEPTYIAECVAALEADREAVACFSEIDFIDARGEPASMPTYNRMNTAGLDLRQRISAVSAEMGWFAIYAVFRTDVLRPIANFPGKFGGDVLLLMDVSAVGGFKILPKKLFHYRHQPKDAQQYILDITAQNGTAFRPFTDLARTLLSAIERLDCSRWEKFLMRRDFIQNVFRDGCLWSSLIHRELGPHGLNAKRVVDPHYFSLKDEFARRILWRFSS